MALKERLEQQLAEMKQDRAALDQEIKQLDALLKNGLQPQQAKRAAKPTKRHSPPRTRKNRETRETEVLQVLVTEGRALSAVELADKIGDIQESGLRTVLTGMTEAGRLRNVQMANGRTPALYTLPSAPVPAGPLA